MMTTSIAVLAGVKDAKGRYKNKLNMNTLHSSCYSCVPEIDPHYTDMTRLEPKRREDTLAEE